MRNYKVALVVADPADLENLPVSAPPGQEFSLKIFAPPESLDSTTTANLPYERLSPFENLGRQVAHPVRSLRWRRRHGSRGAQFYLEVLREKLKGYDIVHVAGSSTAAALTAACLKPELGFRLVCTAAENIPFRFINHRRERYHRSFAVPMLDKFIAVSELSKQALAAEHLREERIAVIHPGVDTNRFKPGARDHALLSKYGCRDEETVLLFVGDLSYRNGIFALLDAARLLAGDAEARRFKCIIAGVGEEYKKVELLIGTYGLSDRIVLAGRVEANALPQLYNSADVVVAPSVPEHNWQEQMGMVCLQAMACRKPVVASQCGVLTEVVGDAGLLAVPGQAVSLYEMLAWVVVDPDLREKLAASGHQRVLQNYDRHRQVEKLAATYRAVLAQQSVATSYAKKVSVIIPVYNRAGIVADAMRSIREQDGVDLGEIEVICIDDGSTDEIDQVLLGFPEVIVIKIEHCGRVGLVRNQGLQIARGEIIAYLDSDDRWKSNHLKTILREFARDSQLGFVATRATFEVVDNEDGRINIVQRGRLRHRSALITDCVAHKKTCSDELGGFPDVTFAEDRILWNKIMLNYPSSRLKKVTAVFRYLRKGNNLSYRFERVKNKYYYA